MKSLIVKGNEGVGGTVLHILKAHNKWISAKRPGRLIPTEKIPAIPKQ
jgi:hypothetical protein